MFKLFRVLSLIVVIALSVTACNLGAQPTATPTARPVLPAVALPTMTAVQTATKPPTPTTPPTSPLPAQEPLYLSMIWHQHQPIYYKDPQTSLYAKPWVRVHAAKDYLDMAAMLEKYPNVHVTFNLTPSLIKQLDDFAAGAKDLYWAKSEIPADQLTQDDKTFILQRFFDTNSKIIARFPRYQELADKRKGGSDAQIAEALKTFTTEELRDLQVLFNLAWTDPDWLAAPPLKALVDKGRGFAEADKMVVFDEHLSIIKKVIPEHAKLQKNGHIQVTMTPYSHPILPLIFDSNLAAVAMKGASLPSRFFWPVDAIAQVQKGIQLYQDHFGVKPQGMWPGEGSVAQQIVGMVGDAGLQWMASDEGVLAMSLGFGSFGRDSQEVVTRPDALYKPYVVQEKGSPAVAMVFRDQKLSDKVGFTYSGMSGTEAANDFMKRLRDIQKKLTEQGAAGPHLVTVILDGENAWEYYTNDGKDFLSSLYGQLNAAADIKTVTPSEYLAKHPATAKIDDLWVGSWINTNFDTWIGEVEENTAWNYLGDARATLQKYVSGIRQTDAASLGKAKDLMYAAEGSDWFWWYGNDQNSGDDVSFDAMFRNTLIDLYKSLQADPPDYLYVPIIAAAPATEERAPSALITPKIDGTASTGEWDKGGSYAGGTSSPITAISYGFDKNTLYLLLESAQAWSNTGDAVSVYLNVPHYPMTNLFSRFGKRTITLGFPASHEVAVDPAKGTAVLSHAGPGETWVETNARIGVGVSSQAIELAIPLEALLQIDATTSANPLESGDDIMASVIVSKARKEAAQAPLDGPARFTVPDLGTSTVILTIKDAKGDDHGPGAYTYPTDPVFKPGVYDILEFSVAEEAANYIFKMKFNGPIENVWGSANGMSVQTIDIYLDTDRKAASGSRRLFDARNAALSAADAWDVAILAEGWMPGAYKVGSDGKPEKMNVDLKIVADPAGTVTIRLPKTALPGDLKTFGYLGVVLSQDGFGPNRVRDVEAAAKQWRLGGGPDDTNHTRVIDMAWDGRPSQEDLLSTYKSSKDANMDNVAVDDFTQLRMWQLKP